MELGKEFFRTLIIFTFCMGLLAWTLAFDFGHFPKVLAGNSSKIGHTEVSIPEKVIKTDEEWRKLLTPEQYKVTRQKGTEPPFTGKYYNFKGTGTYKCVCCGNDLFWSETKFDSGTGWPSFWAPISEQSIKTAPDNSFFMKRTEVLCKRCDAHLGHVFYDGPPPTGLRYCINSVALKFIERKKE